MKSALCIVGMLLLCSAGHARDEVAVRKREVIRLAEELWSSEGGTGMPWWLLLLGGGGAAAYVSLGGGDSDDNVDNGNDGNTDAALGSAEIVGTFAD